MATAEGALECPYCQVTHGPPTNYGSWDEFVEIVTEMVTHVRRAHNNEPSHEDVALNTERYLLRMARRQGFYGGEG